MDQQGTPRPFENLDELMAGFEPSSPPYAGAELG